MTQLEQPAEAIARLTTRLSPVTTEQVDLSDAQGRVLADKIATDRFYASRFDDDDSCHDAVAVENATSASMPTR